MKKRAYIFMHIHVWSLTFTNDTHLQDLYTCPRVLTINHLGNALSKNAMNMYSPLSLYLRPFSPKSAPEDRSLRSQSLNKEYNGAFTQTNMRKNNV